MYENLMGSEPRTPPTALLLNILLLSAATLLFEINLSRLFSVAQFYHFAFMIVSLALLGFGASGTLLAVLPALGRQEPQRSLRWLSLGTGASMLCAYKLINGLPFDSFSIAWDGRQAWILALHYLALTMPFFLCGLAVSLSLSAYGASANRVYAANLLGSALGCAAALLAPLSVGGEGTVTLSAGLAVLAALRDPGGSTPAGEPPKPRQRALTGLALLFLLFCMADAGSRLQGGSGLPGLEIRTSPYKSLSYALQYPGARVIFRRWNAFSRVDLVRSAGIHSLPGQSYRYLKSPPAEDGLLVDGDDLSPVVLPGADLGFSAYLPSALAFQLRPQAQALVLEPRGGLDVLTALENGAGRVTAVEANPLVVEAAGPIYQAAQVETVVESGRSFLRRSSIHFDIILYSLATSYHPVHSGAYSLAEDYRYTTEAFQEALEHLNPDGLMVVTRWMQPAPSEGLRAFAIGVTALERLGADPRQQIVGLRGYNTIALYLKRTPFTSQELHRVRLFAGQRAFDLVYAPDIQPSETNRYNILTDTADANAFRALLDAPSRAAFYESYPFDVRPPVDDRPFFGHFFKWGQAGQVLAELGKTWQPFGGAGYFVILALLALSVLAAGIIIMLPAAAARRVGGAMFTRTNLGLIFYFGLIGLAYLLVEMPLIQSFILFLGQPAYAMTTVLFTLLLFSGLGSRLSERVPARPALLLLVILLVAIPRLLPAVFTQALGLPLGMRLVLSCLLLAPLGFLMGIPFPAGIRRIVQYPGHTTLIPWVWAVNGAASVISAVLAALIALSLGFSWVLGLGALCYAAAWLTGMGFQSPPTR